MKKNIFICLICLIVMCCDNLDENSGESGNLELTKMEFLVPNESSEKITLAINNKSDTIIYGPKGTKIMILSGFCEDKENYDLVLSEYYSGSEIVLQGLSTESDNGLLETKGMIHLQTNDLENQFDFDKIRISFPTLDSIDLISSDTNRYFKIFYGIEGQNSIEWTESKQEPIVGYYYENENVFSHAIYENLFSIDQFGWINCDKYIDDPNSRELVVNFADINEFNPAFAETFLILKNSSVFLRSSLDENGIAKFDAVPLSLSDSITSLSFQYQNDSCLYSLNRYSTDQIENSIEVNSCKLVSFSEFTEILDKKL